MTPNFMRICKLKRTPNEFLALLFVASFAACATAPTSTPRPVQPKEAAPRTVDLLCHQGARAVRFDKVGVPEEDQPIDVAISRDSIWVLFEGGRLLHLSRRDEDHLSVRMYFLRADQGWNTMDVDPLDQSLWVVSLSKLDLYHVLPDGQVSTVKLQKKIEGQGGFYGLRVARDAVYALPICAENAVWRLDRSGKLLGTAFKVPAETAEEAQAKLMEGVNRPGSVCYLMLLERDLDGRLLAWDREKKEAWQVDVEGNWTPSASRLFTYMQQPDAPSLKGVDIGEKSEQWFFAGARGNLFFWKAQPIFMGTFATRERSIGADTVLYVPGENGPREVIMPCNGFGILDADSDATGYAAITHRFVVFGDMASAPDLP